MKQLRIYSTHDGESRFEEAGFRLVLSIMLPVQRL